MILLLPNVSSSSLVTFSVSEVSVFPVNGTGSFKGFTVLEGSALALQSTPS